PRFGYMGAAWATLTCYASMALASYLLGRRYYPVPYDLPRVLGYSAFGVLLFLANGAIIAATGAPPLASGTLLLALYLAVAWALDGRPLWRRLRHR
ncbi:MAG: polysaccharide biosynthesis C-terminal domain-containing protein, partial [Rubrivivax sp.]|nr:polysaccharide biosynthesis C-terminal domain-containing protein [Rubrivivax sp.]